MNKNKTILVTGASGFVGANLVRRLVKKNKKVSIIVKKTTDLWRLNDIKSKINIYYDDLADIVKLNKIMKKIQPDIIYHLAAYGAYPNQSDIFQAIKTNILGLVNLLTSAKESGVKMFINTGSSSEYGFKTKPMNEKDLLEPYSNYAVTKAFGSLYGQFLGKQRNFSVITLRYFSVYGPYEEATRLIPKLINGALNSELPPLVSPKVVRDFIYIEDVLDVMEEIVKHPELSGEIINLGTGQQTSLEAIVDLVVKLTNYQKKIIWGNMPNRSWDSNHWVADISKIKKSLHWLPKYDLKRGLKASIVWFLANKKYYA